MPRIHIRSKDGLIYRCWWRVWWHGVYSIILTKAAILHHDFFVAYSTQMPQAVRSLVDELRNCEDIAMQFLIANATVYIFLGVDLFFRPAGDVRGEKKLPPVCFSL